MIYHTVKVDGNKDKWSLSFNTHDLTDRVPTKTRPSALGYYHYPSTKKPTTAAKELITAMIKRHEKEIRNLTKSKVKLQELLGTLK